MLRKMYGEEAMRNQTKNHEYFVIYAIILLFVVISVYPVLRVLTISLRPGDNLLNRSLRIIPEDATLENFQKIFTETPFLLW